MKKILLILLCIFWLIISIREIYAYKQTNHTNNIDYTINKTIQQHEECSHFVNTKTFINYDVLRIGINDNWNFIYNIIASWRWYYIDDRKNLNSNCSFSSIPIVIEISEDKKWYFVEFYDSETNKSNYTKFAKENFSWNGFTAWQHRQLNNDKKIDTLTMAEKYFWINLYEDKRFDCKFCDINRYFYDTIKDKEWKTMNLYGKEALNNKHFIINSDWTAQLFWTKNDWKFTRYFGNNDSTIILKNNTNNESFDRIIIDDLKNDEMTIFTEKIEVY